MYILIIWFIAATGLQMPITERLDNIEQCEAVGKHLMTNALGVHSYECFKLPGIKN